tara:strand:+ start:4013 stop:5104 length:1092 start_codon:yes stop_codon:yes gene_type:complete
MEMLDVLKKLQEIAQTRPELVKDAVANVERTNPAEIQNTEVKTAEGGMSDIHIGAQEAVGEYLNDDGNLKMRKAEVLGAMDKEKANAPFPRSYEIETAMKMVQDDFNDNGSRKHEIDEPYEDTAEEGNEFAHAVQKAKAAGLKKGDKFKVGDEEHTLRDSDFEEVNTNTMTTEDKKPVNEAIQISTDSPEEAGMMMQILKLAGVKPVDDAMINAQPEAGEEMDPGELNKQMDTPGTDGDEMAKFRNMITAPDEEKAEETFDNEPNEKVADVDTLVNVHSGGLNKQKQQVKKEYPGDNPLAVEDKVTEEDLANSLRAQYEGFKKAYQEAAKVAEAKAKPDYIDIDKDGDKKEPMKKAVKDKEAK